MSFFETVARESTAGLPVVAITLHPQTALIARSHANSHELPRLHVHATWMKLEHVIQHVLTLNACKFLRKVEAAIALAGGHLPQTACEIFANGLARAKA
jgi:hypothetical protein